MSKTEELQERMKKELSQVIEQLNSEGKLDRISYVIAQDVLFELTENHSEISEDNNIAMEFVEEPNFLVSQLQVAVNAMREAHSDIDSWTTDKINEVSAEYAEFVWS